MMMINDEDDGWRRSKDQGTYCGGDIRKEKRR